MSDADKLRLNKSIFKDYLPTSDISKFHAIDTGVNSGDPVTYIDKGNNWEYMKDASGSSTNCSYNECAAGISVTAGEWNLNRYDCKINYCYGDIDLWVKDFLSSDTFLENDDSGTAYKNLLLEITSVGIKNSHWTKSYFTYTGATNTALSGTDGFFTKMLAIAPSGSDQRIQIAKNTAATYADQKLTSQEGFDIINELNSKAEDNDVLMQLSLVETPIRCTRSIAKAYLNYLRENKQVNCCESDSTEKKYSLDSLNIYGRPIIVVREWDSIIKNVSDFNDGTKYDSPHRAIVGFKNNERIGTGEADRLNEVKVQYDEIEEETIVKSKYTFGTKIMEETGFILAM